MSIDEALCRVWELGLQDLSDEVDRELGTLLPSLVEAGFVKEWGHSPTGSFWAYTEAGIRRIEELGCN
jgi:hypothetical protein